MNKNRSTIHTTISFCPDCRKMHSARYEQRDNEVYFIVECPRKHFVRLISKDARLFKTLNSRANYNINDPPDFPGYRHVNVIEITNDCNFHCRFCLSSSNKNGLKTYKTLDEITEIGRTVKKEKGYTVTLSGGEPTLHRNLPRIIKDLKKLGLIVNMASNGYLLAKDPNLARTLKKSGLGSIQIQLDSIRHTTHQKHRNNAYIEEKIKALQNCIKAGFRVVIVITATRYNLNELGELINFCFQFIPRLYIISVQLYFPIGHSEFMENVMIDREETVKALASHKELSNIFMADFFRPLPKFRPMKMEVHPHCGVLTIILKEKERAYPIDDFVDMPLFYRKLAKTKIKQVPMCLGYLLLFFNLLLSANKGKKIRVLRAIGGFIAGKGEYSLLLITIEQFMHFRFQDQQRAIRCATALRIKDGMNQRGCWANRLVEYS